MFEFFWSGANRAAVVGGGDFPELGFWISSVDGFGVADGDIAVDLAVNEKDRDVCMRDGIFGGNLLHVEVILPAGAKEGDLDKRAEEGASDPGAEVEGLSHAVAGDLAESDEGRFGGDGAEIRMSVEGLEELRGAHGFAEGVDATGMTLRSQKIDPLVNVIAFYEAVGGEGAIAGTVGAGVGEKDGEAVGEEELGVAGHADAVVAETVEKKDGVAVLCARADEPGAECLAVRGGEGGVGEGGVDLLGLVAGICDFVLSERTAGGVEGAVSQVDAADGAERYVEEEGQE